MSYSEFVGKTAVSQPLCFDSKALERYSLGIAERNPRHVDTEHPGYSGPPLVVAASVIPGTGALLMNLNLGSKLMRIVHGGIELSFSRAIRPGDTLTCEARFDGAEQKRSGELLNMGFLVKDAAGNSVCDGVTRYFLRGESKAEGSSDRQVAPTPGPPTFEVTETMPQGQSLLYAEGSGDRFPIHTNAEFARSVGLPDVIVHGMCTLAFATRAVVDAVLDGEASSLRDLSVRFAKMVFHGDTLTTRIWVDGAAIGFVTVNQRGERVLEDGKATIDLAS